MNQTRLTVSLAGVAAMVSMALGGVARAAEADCTAEAKQVEKAIVASPDSVLKVVAERVAAAPKCSCEIVSAAISASKADKAMVVQIVSAAADVAPDEVPNIINCAVQSSPEAAAAIAAKFGTETAGAGKGVVASGKEPVGKGKVPVQPAAEEDFTWDFGLMQPGVGGIYLITPGGGFSGSNLPDKDGDGIPDQYDPRPNDPREVITVEKPGRPIRPPGPPVSPVELKLN